MTTNKNKQTPCPLRVGLFWMLCNSDNRNFVSNHYFILMYFIWSCSCWIFGQSCILAEIFVHWAQKRRVRWRIVLLSRFCGGGQQDITISLNNYNCSNGQHQTSNKSNSWKRVLYGVRLNVRLLCQSSRWRTMLPTAYCLLLAVCCQLPELQRALFGMSRENSWSPIVMLTTICGAFRWRTDNFDVVFSVKLVGAMFLLYVWGIS